MTIADFNKIKGQDRACSILEGSLASGRIASSYIFSGPPGVGRKSTAMAFAAALNCTGEGPLACGRCRSCVDIRKGIHPDVKLYQKEKMVIPISLIRSLIDSLMFKSYRQGYKVAILDEAEAMNQESANALLLTLEEPPPKSVLILVAGNLQLLPATVLSRCQRIDFQPLNDGNIVEMLLSDEKIIREEAVLAAIMAEGSLAQARDYLSDKWRLSWEEGLYFLKEALERGMAAVLMPGVASYNSQEKSAVLLLVMEKIIRLAYRRRLSILEDIFERQPFDGIVDSLADRLSAGSYIEIQQLLERSKNMLRSNVSPRLVVEGFLLQFCKLTRVAQRSGKV